MFLWTWRQVVAFFVFLLVAFYMISRPSGNALGVWAHRAFSGLVLVLVVYSLLVIFRRK